jgi:hypothetical protein
MLQLHMEEVGWVFQVGASHTQPNLGLVPSQVPIEAQGIGLQPGIQLWALPGSDVEYDLQLF